MEIKIKPRSNFRVCKPKIERGSDQDLSQARFFAMAMAKYRKIEPGSILCLMGIDG